VRQGEWLTIHSQWASTAVIDQDYDVCVLIDDADPTCQPLTPDWPTSRWDADALIQTSFQLQPSPFLSDGPHTVQLALQAEAELLDTAVAIGQLTAESLPRTFTLPHPEQATVITWNDAIRLVGYDLSAEPTLTLYWQALRRLPTSYKIFIHLIDDAGNIVAQVDYVPQNWAYPTNWWEADEYVQDEVVLPITDLPTGTYEMWLGLYDPDTNVRLVPHTVVAQPSNDNAIHLLTLPR
jgi:hypothetical protein